MSTLTYSHRPDATLHSPRRGTPKLASLWRRLCVTLIAARQRRAEREIAAYLQRHREQLSEPLERDVMRCQTDRARPPTS